MLLSWLLKAQEGNRAYQISAALNHQLKELAQDR